MELINHTFIADVHLGKLARLLRMLGFDTVYHNAYTITQLVKIAAEQNRILLSRNQAIRKVEVVRHLIILSEDPFEQLTQVVQSFQLKRKSKPFSRCLVCNGILSSVDKESITNYIDQNTRTYYHEFWQCTDCSRVYWKGSHYERMLTWINELEKNVS